MKKVISLLLVAIMVFSLLTACGNSEGNNSKEAISEENISEEISSEVLEEATQLIHLGTSAYSIMAPVSFEKGELSSEGVRDNIIACYFSDKTEMNFDVYQRTLATGETLVSFAVDEAVKRGNVELKENTFNGIWVPSFNDVKENDGQEYPTITYIMEDGKNIVQLEFSLVGDNAQAEVDAIMATLTKADRSEAVQDSNTFFLGDSSFSITPEKAFEKGALTAEEADENQIAYYLSYETLVDIDVFQWTKATGETLFDAAAADAAEYDISEVKESTINGIQVFSYNAVDEFDGKEYPTTTYILEDGDIIVKLLFWLDGANPQAEVDAIMATCHYNTK